MYLRLKDNLLGIPHTGDQMTNPPISRHRQALTVEASDLATRILRLGKAKSAEQVYAHTYNAQLATIVAMIKNGNLYGALDTTRMILAANEAQQPLLRVPGTMRKLIVELEQSLLAAVGLKG